MVTVRTGDGPVVKATECRANRDTNDSALYLEKISTRGDQRGKRLICETCGESVKRPKLDVAGSSPVSRSVYLLARLVKVEFGSPAESGPAGSS
jgi:hypothetical protein